MPSVKAGVQQLGGVASMGVDGMFAVRKGFPFREFIQQCWFIAKVTMVPVVLISIPFGVILALHVGSFARQLGAESSVGAAMVLGIVREAAPVATALLIAGAGGSAMTADLGSRRIRNELDAMEVMGVDPVHRLVLPRLFAAALVAVLLNGLVSAAGILGGWVMAVPVQGGTSGAYFSSFTELAHLPDLWSAMIKATLFGYIAAAISCWYGYSAHGGPKAVGDAVNKAVVLTFIVLFFVNFVLTALYFQMIPPKV
ncbi:MAG TPA: ABC transporter permease [Egicoccus sp.]|nr:ABC transporter permease [Egicoccus sp.]HSK24132.1 ABC transporter permease [Egicoccus sp.]